MNHLSPGDRVIVNQPDHELHGCEGTVHERRLGMAGGVASIAAPMIAVDIIPPRKKRAKRIWFLESHLERVSL